jgi:hypothetical protein
MDGTPEVVELDVSTWTRLAEVEAYARKFDVTFGTAVKLLVNRGLSHL